MTIKTAPTSLDELTNSLLETENVQSLSATDRANLTPADSYYRSKLFTTFHSINPLIAAASPLFSMIAPFNQDSGAIHYANLHKNLVHEIKAFECQAQHHGYRANTVLAARYVLCAWVDEIIVTTQEKTALDWKKQSLLHTFQRESCGSDRFFLILERSCEDPVLYIDLLELLYLCLRFGFQGKYRHQANGHTMLNNKIDKLYQYIREERGEISKVLSDYKPDKLPRNYVQRKLRLVTVLPSLLVVSFFIIFFITPSNQPALENNTSFVVNNTTQ